MSVITLSREYGSGGSAIAKEVARALGYHFADKNTIETVLSEYGLVEFDKEYESIPGFWDRFNAHRMERREILVDMLNQSILALAHHDNVVIVGRGDFAILRGLADVLHVRIQAPLPIRVKRVMEQQPELAGSNRAEMLVKENDRLQKAFIEAVYGTQADSPQAFDLIIDTGKIPADMATAWLVEAAKICESRKSDHERTTASLEVDRILTSIIADVFKCQLVHG